MSVKPHVPLLSQCLALSLPSSSSGCSARPPPRGSTGDHVGGDLILLMDPCHLPWPRVLPVLSWGGHIVPARAPCGRTLGTRMAVVAARGPGSSRALQGPLARGVLPLQGVAPAAVGRLAGAVVVAFMACARPWACLAPGRALRGTLAQGEASAPWSSLLEGQCVAPEES